MQSKIDSKYLLLSLAFFFLFAMQYKQDNLGGHGLSLPVNSMSWIAVSIIIALGAWQWCRVREITLTAFDKMFLMLFLCLLVPVLWSDSPWRETAVDRYLAVLAFWFITISIRQFSLKNSQLRLVFLLVVLGVLGQCFIGLYQFLSSSHDLLQVFRPSGSTQQVNVYATIIATGLGVSLYQLLSGGLSWPIKFIHYLMILMAGILETLVLSRVGILGSVLIFLSISILFFKQWKVSLKCILILLLGVGIGFSLKSIYEVNSRTGIAEIGLRSTIYTVSLELIQERPLMGHGMGKFSSAYINKQADYFATNNIVPNSTVSMAHPHNEFLYWWIEGGILPVIAIIVFALLFSIGVWRNGSLNNKASWLCSIPIILHTQTEYPLYHSVPALVFLAVFVSLSINGKTFKFSPSYSIIPRALAFALSPIVIIFMLSNLHTTWLLHKYWVKGDYKYLFQTINPFTQKASLAFYRSNGLLISGEAHSLVLAEKLLQNEVLVRPTHLAYWSLYNVRLKSEQVEKAQQTFELAQYLYPATEKFK